MLCFPRLALLKVLREPPVECGWRYSGHALALRGIDPVVPNGLRLGRSAARSGAQRQAYQRQTCLVTLRRAHPLALPPELLQQIV